MQEEQYADLYWDRDPAEHEKFVAQLAPIVLFTYNRLKHTKQTVEALQANVYAADSELYIYSDAPKNEKAAESVTEVREYLHSITGFKKITIVEREENWGLARNIIDGVTKIVNEYGKIIVLEDDIVTSRWFLKYMNDALKVYENRPEAMAINGYVYNLDDDNLPETFFTRFADCWGWATWKEAWEFFEREPEKIRDSFNDEEIYKFNFDNNAPGYFSQIIDNCEGKLFTWAIFWYVAVFKYGYSLMPRVALCKNVGCDATGEHCSVNTIYDVKLGELPIKDFSLEISDSTAGYMAMCRFEKKANKVSLLRRIGNKVKAILKG